MGLGWRVSLGGPIKVPVTKVLLRWCTEVLEERGDRTGGTAAAVKNALCLRWPAIPPANWKCLTQLQKNFLHRMVCGAADRTPRAVQQLGAIQKALRGTAALYLWVPPMSKVLRALFAANCACVWCSHAVRWPWPPWRRLLPSAWPASRALCPASPPGCPPSSGLQLS